MWSSRVIFQAGTIFPPSLFSLVICTVNKVTKDSRVLFQVWEDLCHAGWRVYQMWFCEEHRTNDAPTRLKALIGVWLSLRSWYVEVHYCRRAKWTNCVWKMKKQGSRCACMLPGRGALYSLWWRRKVLQDRDAPSLEPIQIFSRNTIHFGCSESKGTCWHSQWQQNSPYCGENQTVKRPLMDRWTIARTSDSNSLWIAPGWWICSQEGRWRWWSCVESWT